jgi:hypothetical protein
MSFVRTLRTVIFIAGASSAALIHPSPAGLPRATMCRDNSAAQP